MLRSQPFSLISACGTSRTSTPPSPSGSLAGPVRRDDRLDIVGASSGSGCGPWRTASSRRRTAHGPAARLACSPGRSAGRRGSTSSRRGSAAGRSTASSWSPSTRHSRIAPSAPPRNSTPCGITTPTPAVCRVSSTRACAGPTRSRRCPRVAVPHDGRPHGSCFQTSAPQFFRLNGGLAMTTSKRCEPAALVAELRVAQRVAAEDLGVLDVVQEEVHARDGGGREVDLLPVEAHLRDASRRPRCTSLAASTSMPPEPHAGS